MSAEHVEKRSRSSKIVMGSAIATSAIGLAGYFGGAAAASIQSYRAERLEEKAYSTEDAGERNRLLMKSEDIKNNPLPAWIFVAGFGVFGAGLIVGMPAVVRQPEEPRITLPSTS